MTATDELRRMLDEHDEYYKTSGNKTWWGRPIDRQTGKPINMFHYQAQPMGEGRLFVELQLATPAQAIAATVGRGTCHLEEIEKDCDTASEYMLDREFCFDAVYRCSCGCRFGHVAHNRPRFCPSCGAKVVD